MAHFTEAQAVSSSLNYCYKEFMDGNFSYWILGVSGSDGQGRQFIDHELAESATLSQIKKRLIGHLTGSTNFYIKPTPPVVSASAHFPTGIGKKLG